VSAVTTRTVTQRVNQVLISFLPFRTVGTVSVCADGQTNLVGQARLTCDRRRANDGARIEFRFRTE
jgi:hypothetical protein